MRRPKTTPRIAFGAVAITALIPSAIIGLNSPSPGIGIDERPLTFIAVYIPLLLILLLLVRLATRFRKDPKGAWRRFSLLLAGWTLVSITLDISKFFLLSISFTSWWTNPLYLLPGAWVRRFVLQMLLPLVGIDGYSLSLSGYYALVAFIAFLGLGICGAIWFLGEIIISRRIIKSHLTANDSGET